MKESLVFCRTAVAVLSLAGACLPGSAETYTWTGLDGDSRWTTPGNWEPSTGAPVNTDDNVVFNLDNDEAEPVTVKLDRSVTNHNMRIEKGHFVFEMQENSLTLLQPTYYIAAGGQTGTLKVVNGMIDAYRMPGDGNNMYTYIGSGGASTFGRLVLSGTNAVYRTNTRTHFPVSVGGRGELIVENGAELYIHNIDGMSAFYPAYRGNSLFIVSNAVFRGTTGYNSALATAAKSVAIITGPEADWRGAGRICVGQDGYAELNFENGVKAVPSSYYLEIAHNPTAVGIMTLRNSTIGMKDDGSSCVARVRLGAAGDVAIGAQASPGGKGTLNVLDGSIMMGIPSSGASELYFYIGPECQIRIRDSWIDWCDGDSQLRKHPFRFDSGSTYTLELTGDSASKLGDRPFIYSRADKSSAKVNLISDEASFELILKDSYTHEPGTRFCIFQYSGELQGQFGNYEDGEEFSLDGNRFRLDYNPNGEKKIVLSALAPLGSMLMVR